MWLEICFVVHNVDCKVLHICFHHVLIYMVHYVAQYVIYSVVY